MVKTKEKGGDGVKIRRMDGNWYLTAVCGVQTHFLLVMSQFFVLLRLLAFALGFVFGEVCKVNASVAGAVPSVCHTSHVTCSTHHISHVKCHTPHLRQQPASVQMEHMNARRSSNSHNIRMSRMTLLQLHCWAILVWFGV